MSQASKQIEWCLSKAKKEIGECKRLGKKGRHRGLLEVGRNDEEAKEHIQKAEHNFNASERMKEEFSDISVSTVFYSMYHCFLAIAAKFGYESGNQTCTISLMKYLKEEKKIDIDEKFIELFMYNNEEESNKNDSIIDLRENYTYGVKVSIEEVKIDELILLCRELIEKTKEIVYAI